MAGESADDLRTIRQIMERARHRAGRYGGRFMVLWGTVWLVGFLGNQFLPGRTLGWFWLGLTSVGTVGSAILGARQGRRARVRTPVWRPIVLWMVATILFVGLIVWRLRLSTTHDIALVIVLTVALTYVQVGLFSHWAISLVGTALAALTVAAELVVPGYFFAVMAFLSGGLLIGSGLWFVRQEN